jgi:uncharacterized protein (TIGR02246 family)
MNQQDTAIIESILDHWKQGWQNKDAHLASQDYAEDADWINAFGMHGKGRREIETILSQVFSLPHVMAGRGETQKEMIRFLRDDVALVSTQVERTGQLTPSGESLGVRRSSHLRVFARAPEGWQIVSHLISDARDRESAQHS